VIAGQNNKVLVVGLLISGLAIGAVKVVNDKKRKKMLSQLGGKFDQQDRDFMTEVKMRDAFWERNKDKNLTPQETISAFENMKNHLDE
tara:strand:- start:336 stop:599 length:264 start_codon:yes stop_codon:yes gene_type:complete